MLWIDNAEYYGRVRNVPSSVSWGREKFLEEMCISTWKKLLDKSRIEGKYGGLVMVVDAGAWCVGNGRGCPGQKEQYVWRLRGQREQNSECCLKVYCFSRPSPTFFLCSHWYFWIAGFFSPLNILYYLPAILPLLKSYFRKPNG